MRSTHIAVVIAACLSTSLGALGATESASETMAAFRVVVAPQSPARGPNGLDYSVIAPDWLGRLVAAARAEPASAESLEARGWACRIAQGTQRRDLALELANEALGLDVVTTDSPQHLAWRRWKATLLHEIASLPGSSREQRDSAITGIDELLGLAWPFQDGQPIRAGLAPQDLLGWSGKRIDLLERQGLWDDAYLHGRRVLRVWEHTMRSMRGHIAGSPEDFAIRAAMNASHAQRPDDAVECLAIALSWGETDEIVNANAELCVDLFESPARMRQFGDAWTGLNGWSPPTVAFRVGWVARLAIHQDQAQFALDTCEEMLGQRSSLLAQTDEAYRGMGVGAGSPDHPNPNATYASQRMRANALIAKHAALVTLQRDQEAQELRNALTAQYADSPAVTQQLGLDPAPSPPR